MTKAIDDAHNSASPTAPGTAAANLATKLRRPRRMARETGTAPSALASAVATSTAKAPRGPSKIDQVLSLLRRPEGATLDEMVAATGWLPHTTRAALTGLRKKGHDLAKDKRGAETCYRAMAAG